MGIINIHNSHKYQQLVLDAVYAENPCRQSKSHIHTKQLEKEQT